MGSRASELIERLGLQPHPEGGWFAETWRSSQHVMPADGRGRRSGLTVIHFLLGAGDVSRWHRVLSDEAWQWCEGAPLELLLAPPTDGAIRVARLGPLTAARDTVLHEVVPAGTWQAARSTGAYSLVTCCVGPGFDFADFTMLRQLPQTERPRWTPDDMATLFV